MRRSLIGWVSAVGVIVSVLLPRVAWSQAEPAAVSAFIIDRNVIDTLLQPGSPTWQAIVAGLGAPRVLVCDTAGLTDCDSIPPGTVAEREANIRRLLSKRRPAPDGQYRVVLTQLWQLFSYGYEELTDHWQSLQKSSLQPDERTIRFTLITRPEIYLHIQGGDTLINAVPAPACLGRDNSNSEFKIARPPQYRLANPPQSAIVIVQTILDNPQHQLSQNAQNFLAAIAGNVSDAGGTPAATIGLMQPSRLQCPRNVRAAVTPLILNLDNAACLTVPEPVSAEMDACPAGRPGQTAAATRAPLAAAPAVPPPATASAPQLRPPAAPAPVDQAETTPASPAASPPLRTADQPPPRATPPVPPSAAAQAPAAPSGSTLAMVAPPFVPPAAPANPPATSLTPPVHAAGGQSVIGMGAVVVYPLVAQASGLVGARWEGHIPSGDARVEISGPVIASGGPPSILPAPTLNAASAARGHYNVSLVVQGRPSSCLESRLDGSVTVSGGGVAGFVAKMDLVVLMCPNDGAVAVAAGGFDLP